MGAGSEVWSQKSKEESSAAFGGILIGRGVEWDFIVCRHEAQSQVLGFPVLSCLRPKAKGVGVEFHCPHFFIEMGVIPTGRVIDA